MSIRKQLSYAVNHPDYILQFINEVYFLFITKKYLKAINRIIQASTGRNPLIWYYVNYKGQDIVLDTVGDVLMLINITHSGVSRWLFTNGIHERKSSQVLKEELAKMEPLNSSEDRIIIDIGSNIGYFALLQKKSLGCDSTLYAIEPDPRNRNILQKNIVLNGFSDKTKIYSCAISDQTGKAKMLLNKYSNQNKIIPKHTIDEHGGSTGTMIVPTYSLNKFTHDENINTNKISAVRMDVEGHEKDIIPKMDRILDLTTSVVLFIEFHPRKLGEDTFLELISFIRSYNFKIISKAQNTISLDEKRIEELTDVAYVEIIFKKNNV